MTNEKELNFKIYAIVEKDTNIVRYVGKTTNFNGRLKYHFSNSSGTGTSMYSNMKNDLGLDHYYMVELDECSKENSSVLEDYYICKYSSLGNKLWNKETNYPNEVGLPAKSDRLNTKESRSKAYSTLLSKYGNKFGDIEKAKSSKIVKYGRLGWNWTPEALVKKSETNIKKYGYSQGACMKAGPRVVASRSRCLTKGKVYLFGDRMIWGVKELHGYLNEYLRYDVDYEDLKWLSNQTEVPETFKDLPSNIIKSIVDNSEAIELAPLMLRQGVVDEDTVYDKSNKGIKVYSANPWFNDEQMERSEYMKDTLNRLGFNTYDPKSVNLVSSDSNRSWRELAFNNNLKAIDEADFVLAVTDGKDMGVCFECGYAYSVGTPIVYFAETLGNNKFNLMLAQSGCAVITSRDQLEEVLTNQDYLDKILANEKCFGYDGEIE